MSRSNRMVSSNPDPTIRLETIADPERSAECGKLNGGLRGPLQTFEDRGTKGCPRLLFFRSVCRDRECDRSRASWIFSDCRVVHRLTR